MRAGIVETVLLKADQSGAFLLVRRVEDKWALLVIATLQNRTWRYSEAPGSS